MYGKNTNLYLSLILIIFIIFSFLTVYAASSTAEASSSLRLSAKAAVLYEPETETFILQKNAYARLPMASTTKIMTALIAIENSSLDETVKIADEAIGTEGSSAYLKSGDVLTMEELIYALMLQSANDAAVAIAYHIAGGNEAFSDMMNERAASLGLVDTHFDNPHGLDSEEHYTTARELALIAAEAIKNPTFKLISSTYKKSFLTDTRQRTYVNHNKLLKFCDGSIGMKTGFTKKSGRCLVGATERNDLTFITVTLDAPDDWNDHKRMFELGYSTLEKIVFANSSDYAYTIPVLDGDSDFVTVKNVSTSSCILPCGNHHVDKYVNLTRFAVAPINKGDILGKVEFTIDGNPVATINLLACERVDKTEEKSLIKRLYSIFHKE